MADAWVVKDGWTPLFDDLDDKADRVESSKRMGRTGQQIVSLARRQMTRSKGFADGGRYKPLKGKWRYHGRKVLTASSRNLRRSRGSRVVSGGVSVVNKTRIDASTKPLIDTGALRKSWAVLRARAHVVEVGNDNQLDAMKAFYNDDRGDWDWGNQSSDYAHRVWLKEFDRKIFD